MKNYKNKVYEFYSSNRDKNLIPDSMNTCSRTVFFNKIIKNHIPQNKNLKILELGCGYGSMVYYLNKNGYSDVIGIDISEEQVKGAEKLGINNIIKADSYEFLKQQKGNTFDIIIAFDLIEHYTKESLFSLIEEVNRTLKHGGLFISHQPNLNSPFAGSILYGDITHETGFTSTSISQLLKTSGFKTIKCYEDSPIAHGFTSFLRFLLWKCLIKKIYQFFYAVETGHYSKNIIFSQNFLTIAKK